MRVPVRQHTPWRDDHELAHEPHVPWPNSSARVGGALPGPLPEPPSRTPSGACDCPPEVWLVFYIRTPSRHDRTTLTAWGQPRRGRTPDQSTASTHTAVSRFPRRLTAVRHVAVDNCSRSLIQNRCGRWRRYGHPESTKKSPLGTSPVGTITVGPFRYQDACFI
jgi:hypothetical protein